MEKQPIGFENAAPFFNIVMEGLVGEVDGEHFWDAVADDAIFDFLYNFPGFPNRMEGRSTYMSWFSNYGIKLNSADNLRVYKAQGENIIIMEYQVHGIEPYSGRPYDNRFCSIVTVKDRKIVYWRDYMDSLAVMQLSSN
ncbi:limonene-1,2-epoxide hydrolase [Bacillus sp. FJAT-27264]|uniref:nuclear transport factor 2 family protein n=1 Tax=Paenibacillus sp. (strain DSM 101736 / FJAT-27264) TaxID=1850362 RepID=UPI000807B3B3|nr:nuclear transport factor 2 family protein [Bacillus sp. FJAT-27264]OBZ15015.1 limonene-1,2-epoxide hydrolase [Bacillus sp. FJAT-27264]